ncbi:MAG: phosphoribosylformylglycinamidine synthase subunit PurS [candidate division Zixibacteria bacterium]|nr:phosphoribosylformylglycinamidine synthase subunit PurS [candidate division Zixibacteria bacterium]
MATVKGTVRVHFKDGVLDPQGKTIHTALRQMGYDWVSSVRTGRLFEIEIDADDPSRAQDQLREISQKLLANPVIESFHVEVHS